MSASWPGASVPTSPATPWAGAGSTVYLVAGRIARMSYTLDPLDVLLSKLQIVKLNEKDVRDIVYVLSGYPVRDGTEAGIISLDLFRPIVGDDWGWWRTVDEPDKDRRAYR